MNEDSTDGSKTKDGPPDDNLNGNQDERLSILTVARVWWPWCLGLIFVLTIVWTALVAWTIIARRQSRRHTGDSCRHHQRQRSRRVLDYHILSNDSYGAGIWRRHHRGHCKVSDQQVGKATPGQVSPGRARGRTPGGARQGREWNRRRLEAEAQGIPFDEPFPGMEDESPSNNGTAIRE